MNNFNYINTLKHKRNEQLSYNKNIKKISGREDSTPRKIRLLLFEWTSRSLVSQRSLFTYTVVILDLF